MTKTYNLVVTERQLKTLKGIVNGLDIGVLKNVVEGASEIVKTKPVLQNVTVQNPPSTSEYLFQGIWWNSKDKGTILIQDMHPRHAANCCLWMVDNVVTLFQLYSSREQTVNTLPLYKALKKRANAAE